MDYENRRNSQKSGESGTGVLNAGRLQFSNQLAFALAGVPGRFQAEASRIVALYPGVGGVFAVPMAHKAFADLALPDAKQYSFFVLDGISALVIGSLKLNP